MLKNAPTLAIVAVHTAENEPLKVLGVIQFNIQSSPRYALEFFMDSGMFDVELHTAKVKFGASLRCDEFLFDSQNVELTN